MGASSRWPLETHFHGSFRFRWPRETHFHGSFRFRMPPEISSHGSFRFRWLPVTHFQAELPENCIFQNRAAVVSQLTGAHKRFRLDGLFLWELSFRWHLDIHFHRSFCPIFQPKVPPQANGPKVISYVRQNAQIEKEKIMY